MASAVLESGRTALQEGAGAFAHVFGGEQQTELRTFVFQAGVQAAFAAHVHRVEQATQGQRRRLCQLPGQGLHAGVEPGGGHHLVDDAQGQCACGVDRGAQQAQLQRGRPTTQAQQALAAAEARNQAEIDLRLADLGGIGGDAQMAGHGQFQPAAQRKSVHAGDHRLGHAFDAAHQRLAEQGEITSLNRAQCVHFRDVGAGYERLGAGAGQHHHPYRRVGGGVAKRLGQGLQGGGIEGVELVRALHGNGADGAVIADVDRPAWAAQNVPELPPLENCLMKLRSIAVAVAALALTGNAFAQDIASEKGKLSYYFGYDYGNNLAELTGRGEQLDINSVVKGLQDAYAKKQPAITAEQLKPAVEAFQKREQGRAQAAKAEYEKAAAENKTKSDQFMAQNKAKAGVQTLPSGVQYRVIEAGKGAKPTQASTVQLEVAGPFPYGQRPAEARPAQQIPSIKVSEVEMKAMRETLLQMPAGSKWEVSLPPDQAYGADPRTPFPPNVAVQFEIKLISVK
uniref:peptidylprolyl isomerase n=2 Tax=cellular organisms TaxID=131567 RepID=A0AA38XVS3_9EURO|nr:hypothetical protein H2204_010738 [Knufia peltigerae]